VRREHAVMEDQVDPWTRRPCGQFLGEFRRRDEQMARAVGPRGLERGQDVVVVQTSVPGAVS
jgi:hypothetical protein